MRLEKDTLNGGVAFRCRANWNEEEKGRRKVDLISIATETLETFDAREIREGK